MLNHYKSALEKIKLEEEEKNKAKALFFWKDEKEEHNSIKVKKILRPAAVIAAVMALLLLAGIVIPDLKNRVGDTDDSAAASNDFTIIVYAKELSETEAVCPDRYESGNGGMSIGERGQIGFEFQFPVECKGKNIDTITYAIQNGVFQITNPVGCSIVVSGEEAAEQVLDASTTFMPGAEEEFDESNYEVRQYQSFTVDYNCQKDDRNYIVVVDSSDFWDQEKLKQYESFDYDICLSKDIEKEIKIWDFFTKDLGITCTVTYKDGTDETKKIVVSNKIVMMSELQDIPKEDDWGLIFRCFSIR